MDYQKIYKDLIQTAQLRPDISILNGYTEMHHILPKSMGGSDNKDNLVKLTAREHFIAHWLLWRIHKNKAMAFAFHSMSVKSTSTKERYYNSRGYEIARKAMSESLKGTFQSEEHKNKISESLKGNLRKKGKKLSEESKNKISQIKKGNKNCLGRKLSEETKKKISISLKGNKNKIKK